MKCSPISNNHIKTSNEMFLQDVTDHRHIRLSNPCDATIPNQTFSTSYRCRNKMVFKINAMLRCLKTGACKDAPKQLTKSHVLKGIRSYAIIKESPCHTRRKRKPFRAFNHSAPISTADQKQIGTLHRKAATTAARPAKTAPPATPAVGTPLTVT